MELSILSSFLPFGLLNYFEVMDFKELGNVRIKKDCFYLYLEEKNELPSGYNQSEYESKGFYETSTIQDFPIRGKAFYLCIKRRRWRSKLDKKKSIKGDYSFIAEGSKITIELSAFLKDTGRDSRRYDK
jgi:hypothetical protein